MVVPGIHYRSAFQSFRLAFNQQTFRFFCNVRSQFRQFRVHSSQTVAFFDSKPSRMDDVGSSFSHCRCYRQDRYQVRTVRRINFTTVQPGRKNGNHVLPYYKFCAHSAQYCQNRPVSLKRISVQSFTAYFFPTSDCASHQPERRLGPVSLHLHTFRRRTVSLLAVYFVIEPIFTLYVYAKHLQTAQGQFNVTGGF